MLWAIFIAYIGWSAVTRMIAKRRYLSTLITWLVVHALVMIVILIFSNSWDIFLLAQVATGAVVAHVAAGFLLTIAVILSFAPSTQAWSAAAAPSPAAVALSLKWWPVQLPLHQPSSRLLEHGGILNVMG